MMPGGNLGSTISRSSLSPRVMADPPRNISIPRTGICWGLGFSTSELVRAFLPPSESFGWSPSLDGRGIFVMISGNLGSTI